MKIDMQKIGEYVYKATNLTTIAGGLLTGHGIGNVLTKGDISDWMEFTAGLIIASSSLIYSYRNAQNYDPKIIKINKELSRSKEEISRSEREMKRLESEISNYDGKIKDIQSQILRDYTRLN